VVANYSDNYNEEMASSSGDLIGTRLNFADSTRSDLTDSIAARTDEERASDSVGARSDLTDPSSDSTYFNNARADDDTAERASERVDETVDYSEEERVDVTVDHSEERVDETVDCSEERVNELIYVKGE
ncbi:4070_t:CDS:1, partial [Racocetra fulgida]